jgi:hypothetical protein
MGRSDPRAGQHRDGGLGDHRQVDGHPVALLDAQLLEGVGELAHFAVELPVRVHPPVARLAFPDQRRLVGSPAIQVPVEAVVGHVELAADEPARERRLPLEHRVPLPEPVQSLGPGRPEGLAIPSSLPVGRVVSDGRRLPEILRRLVASLLVKKDVDLTAALVRHSRVSSDGSQRDRRSRVEKTAAARQAPRRASISSDAVSSHRTSGRCVPSDQTPETASVS